MAHNAAAIAAAGLEPTPGPVVLYRRDVPAVDNGVHDDGRFGYVDATYQQNGADVQTFVMHLSVRPCLCSPTDRALRELATSFELQRAAHRTRLQQVGQQGNLQLNHRFNTNTAILRQRLAVTFPTAIEGMFRANMEEHRAVVRRVLERTQDLGFHHPVNGFISHTDPTTVNGHVRRWGKPAVWACVLLTRYYKLTRQQLAAAMGINEYGRAFGMAMTELDDLDIVDVDRWHNDANNPSDCFVLSALGVSLFEPNYPRNINAQWEQQHAVRRAFEDQNAIHYDRPVAANDYMRKTRSIDPSWVFDRAIWPDHNNWAVPFAPNEH